MRRMRAWHWQWLRGPLTRCEAGKCDPAPVTLGDRVVWRCRRCDSYAPSKEMT